MQQARKSRPAKRTAKRGAKSKAARTVRATMTVASAVRRIQKDLGLPEGAVSICLPSGGRARADKTIGKLREAWQR